MKAIDPALICQVANPEVYLPCKEMVDDLRCENLERGHTEHWVGEHTIRHRIAGLSHSCEVIEGVGVEALEDSEENASNKPVAVPPAGAKLDLKVVIGMAVVAVLIAIVAAYGVARGFSDDPIFNENGNMTAVNTKLAPFNGQEVENANAEQKALGTSKTNPTTPPAFIFSNDKESTNRKVMDLYIDFNDKESRDLILLNQTLLQSLVESGRIELHIHAVPSGEAYSMYAPETLAETFYYSPEKAWPTLLDILKFADEKNRESYGAKKLAEKLAGVAKENKVEGIDAESILNGTFASWLLSITADEKLAIGTQLPSMYLADSPIDLPTVDLSTNTVFNAALEE